MRLQRLFRDTRAAASAEFVLILPGIAFVLFNVVDLSMYIWTKMQVDLAAHEAVGAARVLCDTAAELPATTNCANLNATMSTAAQSTSLGSSVNVDTANTTERYYCANSSGVLVQVALATATPPSNCSATVAGSTTAPGLYIGVTASRAFNPIFAGASITSALATPITRTAWLRLK